MVKTRVPIISEMHEAGLEPICFHIEDYDWKRQEIHDARKSLKGVEEIYIGEPRIVQFPSEKVHWENFYDQRIAAGQAAEYGVTKANVEFKAEAPVDAETGVAKGTLVAI